MKSTQERILELLEIQKTATVAQLSNTLQVTQADIRHHLRNLSQQKLVEVASKLETGERGRPRTLYRLAPRARRDNILHLAQALINSLRSIYPDTWTNQLAENLASVPTTEEQKSGPLLYQTVNTLNDLEYQARWEAHATSPRIILGNCPYLSILDENPELCQMDALLLAQLTGMIAQQKTRLESTPMGALQCIFHLIDHQV